jgi:Mn-dependent DtxR family transcriptional regulator
VVVNDCGDACVKKKPGSFSEGYPKLMNEELATMTGKQYYQLTNKGRELRGKLLLARVSQSY